MKTKTLWGHNSIIFSTALVLAACGDNSGSQATQDSVDSRDATTEQIDQLCQEVASGGTISKSNADDCSDCQENAAAAADGDVATAATVYLGGETGTATLGVTSQPGVVYPAGSKATVLVSGGDLHGAVDVKLTTSLAGKLVSSDCVVLTSDDDLALSPVSLTSDSAFDSIDVSLVSSDGGDCGVLADTLADDVASIISIDVHEFCATYGSGV